MVAQGLKYLCEQVGVISIPTNFYNAVGTLNKNLN